MEAPEETFDEAERLAQLRELRILDSGPAEAWDRITRLASRALHVPIALVSLIDVNRQWFKCRVGLEADETDRDISFCAHAIHAQEIMVIPDALADPRFADNPLVTGPPHIRFYAGAPVKSPWGTALGTLCVIDREPRTPSPEELETLRMLADCVEDLFALRAATLHLDSALRQEGGSHASLSEQIGSKHSAKQSITEAVNEVRHDLATPLMPLLLSINTIRAQDKDGRFEKPLDLMERNVRRLEMALQALTATIKPRS